MKLDIAVQENGADWLNVRDFGAVGDGITDDTRSFQSAITACPPWGTIYVPTGSPRFLIKEPLGIEGKVVNWRGSRGPAVAPPGIPVGSSLFGDFPGPLISSTQPFGGDTSPGATIDGLGLYNVHDEGEGIFLSGYVGVSIQNCQILAGHIGINSPTNVIGLLIQGCNVCGSGNPAGSIGIMAGAHTLIQACDLSGWDHAVRAFGSCVSIQGCRVEVNKVGFMLGMNGSGQRSQLSRSFIGGNSMEGNTVGIECQAVYTTTISAVGIQGGVTAPDGVGGTGLRLVGAVQYTVFDACAMASCSIEITQDCIFSHVNMRCVSAPVWVVPSPLSPEITFTQCDNPLSTPIGVGNVV